MLAEREDLKLELEDCANQLGDTVPEVANWQPWLVYFLQDLELSAASLDRQHPNEYKALLKQLRDEIDYRIHKDRWEKRIKLTSPIIKGRRS